MKSRNSFDLLRLFAASAVLFSHCFPLSGEKANEPFARFTNYSSIGDVAVDIFFTISGYLIVKSYLRSKDPVDFIVKRLFRLAPALWGAIILTACVLGPLISSFPLGPYFSEPQTYEYLRNLFLDIHYVLPGVFIDTPYLYAVNGSIWTLPIEALMYFAVLALGVSRQLTLRACIVMLALFAWLHIAVPSAIFTANGIVLHEMPYGDLTSFGAFFFAGAILSFQSSPWRTNRDIVFACILMLVLFAKSPVANIVALITLPYLVIAAAHVQSSVSDALTRRGDVSYGLYLYAFPVQQVTASILGNHVSPMAMFLIAYPATLLLACGSWFFIEKPAHKLRDRLTGYLAKSPRAGQNKTTP